MMAVESLLLGFVVTLYYIVERSNVSDIHVDKGPNSTTSSFIVQNQRKKSNEKDLQCNLSVHYVTIVVLLK